MDRASGLVAVRTWLLDLPDWDWLFILGLLVLAPLVVIWPFWLLARFLGAPWTLVVRRQGKEVRRERSRAGTVLGSG